MITERSPYYRAVHPQRVHGAGGRLTACGPRRRIDRDPLHVQP